LRRQHKARFPAAGTSFLSFCLHIVFERVPRDANKINQYVVGAGYVDDCFVLAANYVASYSYSAGIMPPVLSNAFMLQIGLRTIGSYSIPVPSKW
jgi:hypothetical protein